MTPDDQKLPLDADLAKLFASERERPPESTSRAENAYQRFTRELILRAPDASAANLGNTATVARSWMLASVFALGAITGSLTTLAIQYAQSAPVVADDLIAAPTTLVTTSRQSSDLDRNQEIDIPSPENGQESAPAETHERHDHAAPERNAHRTIIEAGITPTSDLDRERELLDVAHAAIARGNAADALTAIARHESTSSRGQLVEEREALRIQAIALRGDSDQAEALTAAFLRNYPDSFFRAAIERARSRTQPLATD